MKKSKILILALVSVFAYTSCKQTLDINDDPNNAPIEAGTPKLIFPSVVASAAGRIGGDLAILGGIWSQFYTQNTVSNQFKDIDGFNLTKTNFSPTWEELYAGSLNDANFVVKKSLQTKDWTYYLMGVTMKAYVFHVIADLYDMAPYKDAFQGTANLQPKFDAGYDIYTGCIAEIDAALAKDFSAKTCSNYGNTDLIFQDGEISKWKKFANTLKLKMYLRMAYAKPAEAEAGIKAMYTAGAEFLNIDASMTTFVDQENKSNPLYEYNFRKLNTDANLKASTTFLRWLQSNNDPRVGKYYQTTTGANTYTGINQGDFLNATTANNNSSKARVLATDPVDFISEAESYFLQAEALERYYGGAGASAMYDKGVNRAFSRLGLSAATLLAGAYAYPSAGTFENKLEAIITQKRASMPGSHALEAYFERNRTGYPEYSSVYSTDPSYVPGQIVYPKNGITAGKAFAKRLLFPDAERSRNTNTPSEKPITQKVWWDVK